MRILAPATAKFTKYLNIIVANMLFTLCVTCVVPSQISKAPLPFVEVSQLACSSHREFCPNYICTIVAVLVSNFADESHHQRNHLFIYGE
jgi:hypothetical protein